MPANNMSITPNEISIFGSTFHPSDRISRNLLDQMFGAFVPLEVLENPTALTLANYLIRLGERALADCAAE